MSHTQNIERSTLFLTNAASQVVKFYRGRSRLLFLEGRGGGGGRQDLKFVSCI